MADQFDPASYLRDLAATRAQAAGDPPPMLERPPEDPYTPMEHNVPPEKISDVRAAISQAIGTPGFDKQSDSDKKRSIDAAVANVLTPKVGAFETFMGGAADAIPGGKIGAALGAMVPKRFGGGGLPTFRSAYDNNAARLNIGDQQNPLAGVAGRTAGTVGTVAASGGFMAPEAGAATVPSLVGGMAKNIGIGAAQGGIEAAGEGKDAGGVAGAALRGGTFAAGMTTAVPVAGMALKGLLGSAVSRADDRILNEVNRATSKNTDQLNQKADAAVDRILSTPALKQTYKDPGQFVKATTDLVNANDSKLSSIYSAAESKAGKTMLLQNNATFGLKELQRDMAGKLSTEEVAHEMQSEIAKLSGKGYVGPEELRSEISRLQTIAYDRSPTAPATERRDAAGLMAGKLKDALQRFVDAYAPDVSHEVATLNNDQTTLLRLRAAAEDRVRFDMKPNRTLGGVAGAAAKAVIHAGAGAEIANGIVKGDIGHVAAGVAGLALPTVATKGGAAIDAGLAAAGRGVTPGMSPNIAKLADTMARAPQNQTRAMVDHVFGPSPSTVQKLAPMEKIEGWGD